MDELEEQTIQMWRGQYNHLWTIRKFNGSKFYYVIEQIICVYEYQQFAIYGI